MNTNPSTPAVVSASELNDLADMEAGIASLSQSRIVRYCRTVPLPQGGVTLAILALGNLYIDLLPPAAIAPIRAIFGCLALALFVTIVGKLLLHPRAVLDDDMQSPVVAPVSATILMSLMQFATYLAPAGGVGATLAVALWYFAVSCNILLMVHVTRHFVISRRRALDRVYPTWFVGYVGIVVASATAGAVNQQALGLIIFWIGFAAYAITFVAVTARVMILGLPDAAKPTFAIYTAPMSLSIAGYLTSCSHPNPLFVLVLVVLAQLLFAVVLLRMPSLLKLPFSPAFAAFTFPFVITATALLKALRFFSSAGWPIASWMVGVQLAQTAWASLMVVYVVALFVRHACSQWLSASH